MRETHEDPTSPVRCCSGTTYSVWNGYIRLKRPASAVRPPLHTKLGAWRHCLYYPAVSDLITNRGTGWSRFYRGQYGCSFWTLRLLFMVPRHVRRVLIGCAGRFASVIEAVRSVQSLALRSDVGRGRPAKFDQISSRGSEAIRGAARPETPVSSAIQQHVTYVIVLFHSFGHTRAAIGC